MKRFSNLWHRIIDFENLLLAARKAQKGKRFRDNVLAFNYNLEKELVQLQAELESKSYSPGSYRTFHIQDPKPRLISAAPYRDRVVHHALCQIIIPIFEKSFIGDSYANRVGLGTHRALRRFTDFARSSRYILQCDIKKYFPSIDHKILKQLIRRKIKCPDTLWLIEILIDSGNPQEPVSDFFLGDNDLNPDLRAKGLPIGNLTSQFLANVYLNGLDHFVKEQLKAKKYLRYVDDFALFSDDRQYLTDARFQIDNYVSSLRLKLHPIKSQLFETSHGANFVGFRVLPDRIRVRSDNLRRARLRLKQLQEDYAHDRIELSQLTQCLSSWEAHLLHGDTYRLRQKIFDFYSFTVLPHPHRVG